MASPLRQHVFADANVLYGAALRDILMELALGGAVALHWSQRVEDEVERALGRQRPDIGPERIRRQFTHMNLVLPAARVEPGAEVLAARLPDPDDEHILRAALAVPCSHIVTFNLADFPVAELAKEGDITVIHPDALLLNLLTAHSAVFLNAIQTIQSSLQQPPIPLARYLENLRRIGVTQTADLLDALLGS
jgi:predicted nucleic acid-binding protein